MIQVITKRKKDQHEPNPWMIAFEENAELEKEMDFLFSVLYTEMWGFFFKYIHVYNIYIVLREI